MMNCHVWLLLRGKDHLQLTTLPVAEEDAKLWAESINRNPTLQKLELEAVVRMPPQGELFAAPVEKRD